VRAIGAVLMLAGVWVILGSPELSGATLLGAVLFLLGLWVAGHAQADREHRTRPRDSTASAVDAQARDMVP
jgi:hypothetical protein